MTPPLEPNIPAPGMYPYVYKILRMNEWANFKRDAVFKGSEDDLRDGFIHLSTGAQLQSTLDKYYSSAQTGGEDIVIAKVDVSAVIDNLKYELARKTLYFPHLFIPLEWGHIVDFKTLTINSSGHYDVSDIMGKV